MKYILYTISFIIIIDILGFMMWSLSSQRPADNFYAGSITSHTINLLK